MPFRVLAIYGIVILPVFAALRWLGRDPGSLEPGVFRWSFEIDAGRIATDDVMSVWAATADGLENIVAPGTLRTHPPAKA